MSGKANNNDKPIALLTVGELQGLIAQSIKENLSSLQDVSIDELIKPELTVTEAAWYLKCHNATIFNYVKRGTLKFIKGKKLFKREDILKHRDNFQKSQRV